MNKRNNKCAKGTARRVTLRVSVISVVLAVLICASSVFFAAGETYLVEIYDGSQVTRVQTSELEAEKVVAEVGIKLSANDKLILNHFKPGSDSRIIICREINGVMVFPVSAQHDAMFAGTIAELIENHDVVLEDGAFSDVNTNAVVTNNPDVVVREAVQVTINVDGETISFKSGAGTVGELLKTQNISLDGDDEVIPSMNTVVTEGMVIDVLRVEYVSRVAVESIPFGKETVQSSGMAMGTSKVTRKGVDGEKSVTYKDRIVNGVVENSVVVSEQMVKAPVNEITTVGTFVSISGLGNNKIERNGKPISEIALPSKYTIGPDNVPTEYKYTITGRAAAYCEPGGLTATGKPVMPGRIAVNPKQIPYGTEMWIVSNDGVVYGYCIAEDTGGFVKKGYFTCDLNMNTEEQCVQWGDRGVTIYVLN